MSRGHDDYQVEPIRGLPEVPPEGEHILWQGAPEWQSLAKYIFHIRAVSIYFVGLMAWRAYSRVAQTGDSHAAIASILALLPFALAGVGLLALLAWLSARTTVYTITNRRVVIRAGVALPAAVNIPFCLVGNAGLLVHGDGTGDIPLTLTGNDRIGYSNLWPHVRPWRFNNPAPMLRGIAEPMQVAQLLGEALHRAMPETPVTRPVSPPRQTRPARHNVPNSVAAAS